MLTSEQLQQKLNREKNARKEAERVLEEKSLELYKANQQLSDLNVSLEQKFKERSEILADIFSNMYDACLVLDENSKVKEFNDAAIALLGYTPEELKTLEVRDVVYHEDREKSKKYFDKLLEEGFYQNYVGRIVNKSGRIIYVEVNSTAIFENGIFKGSRDIVRDVTERVRNEKEITLLADYARQNPNPIARVNQKGRIVYLNKAAMSLFGNNQDKAISEYRKFLRDKVFECFKKDENITSEIEFHKRVFWVSLSLNERKDLVYIFGRDITEQKKVEKALIEAKQLAERAQKAEKDFLAKMSHELRTPINAIVGMTNLLFYTDLDKEQEEFLNTINYSSDQLLSLISDILDLSKIEAGELEILETEFDLHDLMASVKNMFKFNAIKQSVELLVDLDDIVDTHVIFDKKLLNQILINLFSNALKFTSEGLVKLEGKVLSKTENTYKMEFTVTDTGIGIAKEKIDLIFSNFKQADKEIHIKYGGSGLGLAITKHLVDELGGVISVSSELGKGSEFKVELELQNSGNAIKEIDFDKTVDVEQELSKDLHILVVEDNIMNQKYLCTLLDKWGFTYKIANHGGEALDCVKEETFDLVLMDIRMPVMDGNEATSKIRAMQGNPNANIPIVALTASVLSEELEQSISFGMSDFLSKPFLPQELMDVMKAVMLDSGGEKPVKAHRDERFTETLERYYQGDEEHYKIMLNLFVDTNIRDKQRFQELIDQKDWESLKGMIHKIKPSYEMAGIQNSRNLLDKIEQHCKDQNETEILQTFEVFKSSFDEDLEWILSIIE